jgi:hypothetical protein
VQEYETPNALLSGAPYVRTGGRTIPTDQFFTADMADNGRRKLYKFLENPNA